MVMYKYFFQNETQLQHGKKKPRETTNFTPKLRLSGPGTKRLTDHAPGVGDRKLKGSQPGVYSLAVSIN